MIVRKEPDIHSCIDRLKGFFGVDSDKELAEKIGMSNANLSNYKNGIKRDFPYKHMVAVANKIGRRIDWVLYGNDGFDSDSDYLTKDLVKLLNLNTIEDDFSLRWSHTSKKKEVTGFGEPKSFGVVSVRKRNNGNVCVFFVRHNNKTRELELFDPMTNNKATNHFLEKALKENGFSDKEIERFFGSVM